MRLKNMTLFKGVNVQRISTFLKYVSFKVEYTTWFTTGHRAMSSYYDMCHTTDTRLECYLQTTFKHCTT